jgi:hypothetical protein
MKPIILLFGLGLLMNNAFAGYEKSYETFCFQQHIKDSISINKERRKVYAELTDGRSERIFNKLIGYEYVTLVPATYFDLKALPYQKQGMDLFCHEFMSMIRTPEFDPNTRIIPQEKFKPFDWKFYKDRITAAIAHGSAPEVRQVTLEALIELKSMPNYYCFTRHFIESIYRFAHFVPLRAQQAEEFGLKDPSKMMFNVMKLHTVGIKDCHGIDLWSQPIQMSGIPILCTEIPNLLSDLDVPELEVLKHK